jgi:non-ribosomal peptide synthetase component E (peptide arylation enzyme)
MSTSAMNTKPLQAFNVILFAIYKAKVINVEATSMQEAIDKVANESMPQIASCIKRELCNESSKVPMAIQYIEDAEELSHALVDIQGDDDCEHSKWFHLGKNSTWQPGAFTPEVNLVALSGVMDMARELIRDIESGIEDGTYDAADNTSLGAKQDALAKLEAFYLEATGEVQNGGTNESR